MDKAEDMLSEDTDADHGSDTGTSPPHLGTCGLATGEVRAQVPGHAGGCSRQEAQKKALSEQGF